MNEEVFSAHVVEIGSDVDELSEGGLLITFGANAPETLRNYCFIINISTISDKIRENDILTISGQEFKVLKVGKVANKTLRELGHATFIFNNSLHEETMEGSIYLEGIGKVPSLDLNSEIKIRRK